VKIVVSGASGLIGTVLVPALREAGHDVVRLVRREATSSDEVRWDPAAGTVDRALLAGTDVFVNLSGANLDVRWTDDAKREILESRTKTTSLPRRSPPSSAARSCVRAAPESTGIEATRS
jgi:NAD dependent epimerase/dehydratase family enzyme